MNIIGQSMTVIDSTDPTKKGKEGIVVLETAKMLHLESGGRILMVEKKGSIFRLSGTEELVDGVQLAGRLQDRWRNAVK